ncbi:C40 family peptidase [Streptomyces sp. TP-A0874]|uniref:C40 family peptidase n=1 Tax=Streptomyces sp. TP-A0874 TaxID=549819 RepID=UPI0008535E62|nr:NlpC/P60 family protein [Streptomyces sp. TP-A0874]
MPAYGSGSPHRVRSRFSRLGAASALTSAAVACTMLAPAAASPAQAATHSAKALRIAASKKGAPYQYGAVGPHRFDCSGLTLYAFGRAGKQLPRTADAQFRSARRISAAERAPGDLVFFHSAGHVYHVGIYAGQGKIWHSPKSGSVVRLEKIWTEAVRYGRVG